MRSVMFKFAFVLVVVLLAAAARDLYDTNQLARRDIRREVGLRVGPAMEVAEEWYRQSLDSQGHPFRPEAVSKRLEELAKGRVRRVVVCDRGGVVRASSDPTLAGKTWPLTPSQGQLDLRGSSPEYPAYRFETTQTGELLLVSAASIRNTPSLYAIYPSAVASVGIVAVEAEGGDILAAVSEYWRRQLVNTGVLFGGVLLILVLAYLGWIRRPFLTLVRGAEKAASDPSARIALAGNDEFGRIARQFNQFADAVGEQVAQISRQADLLRQQAQLQEQRVERISRTRLAMHQLASTLDLNLLRSVTVRVAPQVVSCKRAALVFADEGFGCVTLNVYDAESEEQATDTEITRPLPASRLELENTSFWASWRNEVLQEGQARCLDASLSILQRWTGLLMLMRPSTAPPFTEEEQALFHLFVEDLNGALQNARLYDMAIRDGLTGLFTRRYFEMRLEQEAERAGRFGLPLALLVMDLNEFKAVNDLQGHAAGDQVLRAVGQVVMATSRASDLAARYGGDEFAVLLVHTGRAQAELAASRIVKDISAHAGLPELPDGRRVTVSVGIASYPEDGRTKDQLIARADHAMYEHKRRISTGAEPEPPGQQQ